MPVTLETWKMGAMRSSFRFLAQMMTSSSFRTMYGSLFTPGGGRGRELGGRALGGERAGAPAAGTVCGHEESQHGRRRLVSAGRPLPPPPVHALVLEELEHRLGGVLGDLLGGRRPGRCPRDAPGTSRSRGKSQWDGAGLMGQGG